MFRFSFVLLLTLLALHVSAAPTDSQWLNIIYLEIRTHFGIL